MVFIRKVKQEKSTGVLIFRETASKSFLLLKRNLRWDLPKGHIKRGESEIECALRELAEETGIGADSVRLDADFRFETQLQFQRGYPASQLVEKTYVVFLGYVGNIPPIRLTEHDSYQWFAWNPPHYLQKGLIDPLLRDVNRHFTGK